MASAFPATGSQNTGEESFSKMRKRINSKFEWLHRQIENRKKYLLARLDELESTHTREGKQQQTGLSSVLRVQSQVMEELRENNLKYLQDSILGNIQTQIEQLKISVKLTNVYFEFDDNNAKSFVNSLGKLTKVPNYKAKKHPVIISAAKHGLSSKIPGEFYGPTVLKVDPNSGNIFIGCYDGLVHVFSPNAELIFCIDGEHTVMGMALQGNYIFISIACHHIRQYELNGTFIKTIKNDDEHDPTFSMTILNNTMFISSGTYHLISLDLTSMVFKPFVFEKGTYTTSTSLTDIKPTANGDIAILYSETPFLIIYTTQGKIVSKPLCRTQHLKSPNFFTIDSCGNFIISDDYIKIFQSNGDLLHTIGGPSNPELISYALGIDIDSQGRIVSICGKDKNCLQIF